MEFFDYMTIESFASLVTIVAIGISAGKYFFDRHKDRKQASKNLYLELKDTLESLDGQKHLDDAYMVKIKDSNQNDKEAYFINRDFNHDVYDSLIFSGAINRRAKITTASARYIQKNKNA